MTHIFSSMTIKTFLKVWGLKWIILKYIDDFETNIKIRLQNIPFNHMHIESLT